MSQSLKSIEETDRELWGSWRCPLGGSEWWKEWRWRLRGSLGRFLLVLTVLIGILNLLLLQIHSLWFCSCKAGCILFLPELGPWAWVFFLTLLLFFLNLNFYRWPYCRCLPFPSPPPPPPTPPSLPTSTQAPLWTSPHCLCPWIEITSL